MSALAAPASPDAKSPGRPGTGAVITYLVTALVLFCGMGLFGLLMRAEQANLVMLTPQQFYMILTLHGTGMIVSMVIASMAALWYVINRIVPLSVTALWVSYGFVLAAIVCVAISTLLGGFAAAWTFLYPLPFYGWWPSWATGFFLAGQLLVGIAFGLYCLTMLWRVQRAYGGVAGALGWRLLRRGAGHDDDPTRVPPPPIIIATVIGVQGLLTVAGGAVIVVGLLGDLLTGLQLDPLFAKNVTFFYGHSIANLTIYLSAGMLYAILPHYAGRPWKTTRAVVLAWLAVLIFVLTAYFHHLYMDFAQPQALDVLGEAFTYSAVTPGLVVTIFGALMLIWRSGYRWTLGSTMLYLGFAGWLIGGLAAVIDAAIPFNFHFHNTLWVVGHFHTYFLVGVVLFVFGFLTYLLEQASGQVTGQRMRIVIPTFVLCGGYGLVGIWLLEGLFGVPRRYALQPTVGPDLSTVAVGFVLLVIVGVLLWLIELSRLGLAVRRTRVAVPA